MARVAGAPVSLMVSGIFGVFQKVVWADVLAPVVVTEGVAAVPSALAKVTPVPAAETVNWSEVVARPLIVFPIVILLRLVLVTVQSALGLVLSRLALISPAVTSNWI